MAKNVITIIVSVLLSGLTAFGIVKAATPSEAGAAAYTQDGQLQPRTVNLSVSDYPDFTYAAETAVEAVVYVKVTTKVTQQYMTIDPFFRFFFGDEGQMQSREQERQVSGSGVIIRPDGYIVTNNHVIQNASKVEVTLNNNKTYPATIIGSDPATDVALIKIEASGLPTLAFGDSDKLRLGEWVLAIGSPLGEELRSTITAGIVSAKGRSMPSNGEFKIESFIQTDAAVNPGNSGGALVNKKGELVGINTAIVSQTGAYSGYSFAVPVNIVKKIVEDLIDFGSVKRAKLGIAMTSVNDEIAKEAKTTDMNGAYVAEVSKGGAAEQAGIKVGDIIKQVGGTTITNPSSLQAAVNSYHPGDKVDITVWRNGENKVIPVEFKGDMSENGTVEDDGSIAFYGAKIKTAPKETLAALGLKSGVEVVSVGDGKLNDQGVRAGFIIQYVNDQAVSTAEEVISIAKKSKRAIYIEGVTAAGKSTYFAFGK